MVLGTNASEQARDVSRVAAALVAERLRYCTASGDQLRLPDWAAWFIELGGLLSNSDQSTRRWVITTVPDRRFAALLAAAGAVAGSHARRLLDPVGSPLEGLDPGDPITWIDADGNLASGVLDQVVDGIAHYSKRTRSHTWEPRKRPLTHCGSFRPMQPGEEPFAGSVPMTASPDFVKAALAGMEMETFHCAPGVDAVICGVRTTLNSELSEPVFSCGGQAGCLLELVRPSGLLPTGQRPRSEIIPSSGKAPLFNPITPGRAVVIFDGAPAFLRWREGIDAACNLVIIDRWTPHARDAATAVLQDEGHMGSDAPPLPIPGAPPGIECITWAGER